MWPFPISPLCASLHVKWELLKLKASKGYARIYFFSPVESFQILAVPSCDVAKVFTVRYRNSRCFFNLVGNILGALEYLCFLNHSSFLLATIKQMNFSFTRGLPATIQRNNSNETNFTTLHTLNVLTAIPGHYTIKTVIYRKSTSGCVLFLCLHVCNVA